MSKLFEPFDATTIPIPTHSEHWDDPPHSGVDDNEAADEADDVALEEATDPKRRNLPRKALISIAGRVRRMHGSFDEFREEVATGKDTVKWFRDAGSLNDGEQLRDFWESTAKWENRRSWFAKCQKNAQGDPRGNLFNAKLALDNDGQFYRKFRYDDMMQRVVLMEAITPKAKERSGDKFPRPMQDSDETVTRLILQEAGLEGMHKDSVYDAIATHARQHRFHPVQDYLKGLKWDGVDRLDKWLVTYAQAEDSVYTRAVGAMFILSMVARVMVPGCQVDHMLVLEGCQGFGKSTMSRELAGEYFSDSLPHIREGDKDLSSHLEGKWLVEIGELSAMGKAEIEATKTFISRRVENYRPAYGRVEVAQPRQCVFIGTTNAHEYLKDETGNRRFWPVRVKKTDTAKLAEDRDQLFAEAMERWRAGEQHWPGADFAASTIVPQQDLRVEQGVWHAKVADWLQGRAETTTLEVAVVCLGFLDREVNDRTKKELSRILRALKWNLHRSHGKNKWTAPLPV